jgi:hypothetical protein
MGLDSHKAIQQAAFTVLCCPTPRRGNKPLGDALGRFPLMASTASATSRVHVSGGQVLEGLPGDTDVQLQTVAGVGKLAAWASDTSGFSIASPRKPQRVQSLGFFVFGAQRNR